MCVAKKNPVMTDASRFSIQRELATLPEESRATVEQNLKDIDAHLRATTPYVLRDDSRLAFRAASGLHTAWAPWMVVHEMACTQYLSDALPYHQMSQEYLRRLATLLKLSLIHI